MVVLQFTCIFASSISIKSGKSGFRTFMIDFAENIINRRFFVICMNSLMVFKKSSAVSALDVACGVHAYVKLIYMGQYRIK